MWHLLLIVALAGLAGSLIRVMTQRATARPVRRRGSRQPMRTARAVGIPEGEGLQVWLERGRSVPATCTRMVRVSSKQGTVTLSFHSDGPEMDALLDVEVGPIDRSELNVRLVEVRLRLRPDGGMRVDAKVRTTSTPVPVRILGQGSARVPVEVDDTPPALR